MDEFIYFDEQVNTFEATIDTSEIDGGEYSRSHCLAEVIHEIFISESANSRK